jgi:two-component system, chemotaxis family, CheB/CheR fusion protein
MELPPSNLNPDTHEEITDRQPIQEPSRDETNFFSPEHSSFPVVGLGGSAGSLAALQAFFSGLPANCGAAFIIVVHLSADHESLLPQILQRSSTLKVSQVTDEVKLQPGCVYVIPPGKQFAMSDGILKALDLPRRTGRHVVVDLFFRALAESHRNKAVAIILSGGDGDGSIGIKRIKERGGLTIAQDPAEAQHDGMPRSAIGTGMVDWILTVEEMPKRLLSYWENGRKMHLPQENDDPVPVDLGLGSPGQDEVDLRKILAYLKARTGHDVESYKQATILRRVGRRIQVNGATGLGDYLSFLQSHPGEAGALLQDLLISVTNFFRDKESFIALEKRIPALFENKDAADQIRVWVPACATGEEAYSLGMLLAEHASRLTHPPQIQIFATDLDQSALDVARDGYYPATILADVSEERLRRFFTKDERGYRVRSELRESVFFAMHDLLRDSPFSRLDLVSCRNLLIYLTRAAQTKTFKLFHFALRPGAHLFLGSSESADDAVGLFDQLDKKHRIYQRKQVHRLGFDSPASSTADLKTANEELQAMNEELQSINEEINTINQELKYKVEELGRANSDLQNLMTSTQIATIFLDRDLQIKRYTPATAGLFNFIPSDLGRPLSDLTHRLEYSTLVADAEKVIKDLSVVEREVRNLDGRWFLVRLGPYRTVEDQIGGVVITFVDITERKTSEESRRWLSAIVESSNDAIISFGMDGRILSWNEGATQIFGYSAEEMLGKSQASLAPPELQEEKRTMLETLQSGENIASFETIRVRKDGRRIDLSLSASVMLNEAGQIVAATAIARDVSVRKKAVEELEKARSELETRVNERTAELRDRVAQLAQMASEVTLTEQRERRRMAAILHDELQQLLVSVKMRIESLNRLDEEDRDQEIEEMSVMMEEVIANSRSLAIDLSPSVLSEGLGRSLEWLAKTWMKEKYNLEVHSTIDLTLDTGREDTRSLVFSAVREVLFNVVKHSGVMVAFLKLEASGPDELKITVRDHGTGFHPAEKKSHAPASGLGLNGLSERLEMLGGTLRIISHPAAGVEAILTIPVEHNE